MVTFDYRYPENGDPATTLSLSPPPPARGGWLSGLLPDRVTVIRFVIHLVLVVILVASLIVLVKSLSMPKVSIGG